MTTIGARSGSELLLRTRQVREFTDEPLTAPSSRP